MPIIRVDIWVSQTARQEIRAMSVLSLVHCTFVSDKHTKRHETMTLTTDMYVIYGMYVCHGSFKCLNSRGHWLLWQPWFSAPNGTVWRSTSRSSDANVLHFTLFPSDTCNSHVPHEPKHMLLVRIYDESTAYRFFLFSLVSLGYFFVIFCKTCHVHLFSYIVVGASACGLSRTKLSCRLVLWYLAARRHCVARSCCKLLQWMVGYAQGAVDNVAVVALACLFLALLVANYRLHSFRHSFICASFFSWFCWLAFCACFGSFCGFRSIWHGWRNKFHLPHANSRQEIYTERVVKRLNFVRRLT